MKWLQIIFSFIMKHVSAGGEKRNPMEELKEFLRENAIKLFVGMVLIVTIGTMFTAGIYMTVISLTAQADLGLVPRMTAMTWAGVIMALVPVLILSFAWYKSSPHEAKPARRRRKIPEQQPTTIEAAIALLVTDFVKEREMKREIRFAREARMAEAEMNSQRLYGQSSENLERH